MVPFSFFLGRAILTSMQELKAELRTNLGRQAKMSRAAGFLPAVVYGEGVPSQSIAVAQKEFEKIYKAAGESTLVMLDVAGRPYNVLIHDTSRHPVTGRLLHADFYAVRMDKALRAHIPLEFIGESPAVKNEGGILVKVAHELEVEALPVDLPHTLQVDLSQLDAFGARIFLKNIIPPAGVKILGPEDEVLAIVEAPRSDEELAALKEAPVPEAAPVETEQEAKKAVAEAKAKAKEADEEKK
ncbi:MAG: 50S ribosomal protein L25 [Candidatus Sungiibacteriota bacterium]